jgi:citrate lyase subunit beta/citryl-CoA lyase
VSADGAGQFGVHDESTAPRRRSVHFVPGGNERFFAKALDGEADTLVLDLEDSVAPAAKEDARAAVVAWVRDRPAGHELMVRVNALGTPWVDDDVAAVVEAGATSLMVPKVDGFDDLERLDRLVSQHDPAGRVGLMPVATETARGVVELATFGVHRRVDGLCWGAEDLSVALGGSSGRDASNELLPVFTTVRSLVLIGARAGGVQAIDAVFTDLGDLDGLRREAAMAMAMGFDGKITIHPAQVEIVNECFTPTADAVAGARALIAAYEEHAASGVAAFRFEGQMVDAAHHARAQRVLARAGVTAGVSGDRGRGAG